jgi:hypothetical protein
MKYIIFINLIKFFISLNIKKNININKFKNDNILNTLNDFTKNNGNDLRNITEPCILNDIYINIHKKNLLDNLINNNIPIYYKLKIIEENDILSIPNNNNIENGGLYKDWNF